MLNIRKIEKGDNAALSRLIKGVFEELGVARPGTVYTDPTTDALYELFGVDGAAYWIAEEEGRLLGGCGIFPTNGLPHGYAELVKFYLSAQARGKGIGHLLMQKSMDQAKILGYTHLYLESFPELARAVTLYERNGFKTIDAPLGNSGHYACTIWMVKEM